MTQAALVEPFERLLQACCTPAQVRAVERGESSKHMWAQLEQSGFLDALIPEARGGAGLSLREAHPIIERCGYHAMPLPVAETMLARALLAQAGSDVARAPIALAHGVRQGDHVVCQLVAFARTADFALLALDGSAWLLPLAERERTAAAPNALAAELRWPMSAVERAAALVAQFDALAAQAALLAAQMAGAMSRVFTMTLGYANERSQFGRPIGKFQAVQHQISVMAQHAALARTAARIGCDSSTHLPSERRAAIAKAIASEAGVAVANTAHALHGAIGMTQEYDLQLYTRRLHEWRWCAGAETHWHRRLGEALLQDSASMLDFVRAAVE